MTFGRSFAKVNGLSHQLELLRPIVVKARVGLAVGLWLRARGSLVHSSTVFKSAARKVTARPPLKLGVHFE